MTNISLFCFIFFYSMRQQLMEAHDRIARLMAEKSEINKHSQLEGLRNLKVGLLKKSH